MARSRNILPSYTLHKPTGQARVRIAGRDFYLGPFGSDESRRKYGELIARASSGQPLDPLQAPKAVSDGPTVAELLVAFLAHAKTYYVKHGKQTAEVHCFRSAIRPVKDLYWSIPAADFGPACLQAVRDAYVANGWTRTFCNKSVNRIRHVWRWGVSAEMVPVTTLMSLQTVTPLRMGHTSAPDRPKREAVDDERLQAVRAELTANDRDFFDLLLATGARPSELLNGLSMADIDTSDEIWTVSLDRHKCEHLEQERTLYFGPIAQGILKRRPQTGPLFKICRHGFANRVKLACTRAQVEPFQPYHLRHTAATAVRDALGSDAAQATLGHATPDTTAKYSRRLDRLARKAAKQIG